MENLIKMYEISKVYCHRFFFLAKILVYLIVL